MKKKQGKPEEKLDETAETATQKSPKEDPLVALKAELNAAQEERLRTLAELENLRKRSAREQEDARKFGTTTLLRETLSIVDNLERALASTAGKDVSDEFLKTLSEGVQLVHQELLKLLERQGVKKVEAEGARFDPNHHQAISEVEHDKTPTGHVVEVFQQGYVLHDRLLRPAMVTVAKSKPKK